MGLLVLQTLEPLALLIQEQIARLTAAPLVRLIVVRVARQIAGPLALQIAESLLRPIAGLVVQLIAELSHPHQAGHRLPQIPALLVLRILEPSPQPIVEHNLLQILGPQARLIVGRSLEHRAEPSLQALAELKAEQALLKEQAQVLHQSPSLERF